MLNFFRKNKEETTSDKKQDNTTVDASDLFSEEERNASDEEVETPLSLHPNWKLDEEETYVYSFMNNENGPLKPNQISLAGYELRKLDPEVAVGAFVRHSLPKPISFQKTTIVLLDESGRKLARGEFDLSEAGELPPKSSRPHPFIFKKNDLLVPLEDIPQDGWKLAFELKKKQAKHALDLEESWEQSMADEDISKLEDFVDRLKAPKPGEVNFMSVKARQAENGDLHITMLIRNGGEKGIHLQQVPLQVEDASGDVIAKGGFSLEEFEVKANTSKPWTFIFPSSMLMKEEIDLSTFKAQPIQK